MEDQVPFKVFTYWAEDTKPEVRRFGVEKTVVTSFHYLNAKLQDIYPGLRSRNYTVTWKDEDGDDITISSDEELMTALTALHGNMIKLEINVAGEDKEDGIDILIGPGNAVGDAPIDLVHCTVTCDSCNTQVVGFRYKCTSCYDFDLCAKCEAQGLHPDHIMVRIPSPHMSRTLVKAAIKRSRHFLKTVGAGSEAHKRHRRDREPSAERRKHHADRHAPDHCRRPRSTWLDTFASYMNEFANLAGDPERHQPAGDKPNPASASASTDPPTGQPNTETGSAPQPQPTSTAQPNVECPMVAGLENLPKLIEMYFNGGLASYLQNANAASAAAPSSSPAMNDAASVASSNGQSEQSSKDVEMRDAAPKHQEALMNLKTEPSASTSAEAVRDSSPDKVDGWTLINREFTENDDKALDQAAGPIGFNLPREFQERVKINEGQNIYPPLNVATAVLNPKEPERREHTVPQPAQPVAPQMPFAPQAPVTPQAPAAPQAPTAPQPTRPAPQPEEYRARHPMAHIDAAIQQMLSMGFTNEGGWLTKLLEKKDGNIAAVLDLLTPSKAV